MSLPDCITSITELEIRRCAAEVRAIEGAGAMKPMRFLPGLVLAAFCVTGIFAQQKSNAKPIKAVRFGKLWDARGKLWTNAIVIIEGDRIRNVAAEASAIPVGAEVIDLSKDTGLPGLIDVHTHITIYTDATPGQAMLNEATHV